MKLYEFIQLERDEQANILWDEGVYLDSYKTKTEAFNLYRLKSMFVEVTISNQKGITDITAFLRGERLDKYLKKIKL